MDLKRLDFIKGIMISDSANIPEIHPLIDAIEYDDYNDEIVIFIDELNEIQKDYLYEFSEKHNLLYNKEPYKVVLFENPE